MPVPTNGINRGLKRVLPRARPSRPTIAIVSGALENPSPPPDSSAAKSCSAGAVADGDADVPPAAASDGLGNRDLHVRSHPFPLTGTKWMVSVEPVAVTLAQPGADSPAAQLTTPSKSPIWRTSCSTDPCEV